MFENLKAFESITHSPLLILLRDILYYLVYKSWLIASYEKEKTVRFFVQ